VLREHFPEATDQLASTWLRRNGLEGDRLNNVGPDSPVSPELSKAWRNLPQASRDALFPDQAHQEAITTAGRISDLAESLKKSAARSKDPTTLGGLFGSGLAHGLEGYGAGSLLRSLGTGLVGNSLVSEKGNIPELTLGAGAMLLPTVRDAFRQVVGNNPLAARYVGQGPGVGRTLGVLGALGSQDYH
jgi:hypothetical protein